MWNTPKGMSKSKQLRIYEFHPKFQIIIEQLRKFKNIKHIKEKSTGSNIKTQTNLYDETTFTICKENQTQSRIVKMKIP